MDDLKSEYFDVRYDIRITNILSNTSVNYWADSFKVINNQVQIRSLECGDLIVNFSYDEVLSVNIVLVPVEF